ncbi:MAG: Holliday junction resolvase Hjc [Candidatus Nanoarchaeia archaeon]
MASKAKGSNAERELVTLLWGLNFAAVRAAGSGVSRFYSPDVLASNGIKTLAIECKSTKHDYQYFEPEQIRQLILFAKQFGAEPWLAVKFSKEWKFFRPEDAKQTKNFFVVKKDNFGRLLPELTGL